jgi:hypothetical protein
MDDRNSFKIGCRNTGEFEIDPWIDIELIGTDCMYKSTKVYYRITFEIRDIDMVSFA